MMILRNLPAPLLRTLLKMLTRCVKTTYLFETGTQCPPYLSKIRDLSILPNILHVRTPWWKLTLQHVAALFHQGVDDFYQQLMCDSRTLPSLAVEEIGRGHSRIPKSYQARSSIQAQTITCVECIRVDTCNQSRGCQNATR